MYRAIRHARTMARNNTLIPEGECVRQVRLAMDILSGTPDLDHDNDNDAVDAWLGTSHKRVVKPAAPFTLTRGAWVHLMDPDDPSRHGHAAIATGYGTGQDSTLWSPGTPKDPTHWRKVTVAAIQQGWGLVIVGEGYDLNGHPVPDLERG